MSRIKFKENGEIDCGTPLEPFFEAMLPLLENYGFSERFPADKPSVFSGGLSGYQYDILIGKSPTAFRYINYTPGGYSAFPDEERTIESVGFIHIETDEKFYIRISISGYPDNRLQIVLEFSGAESEVKAFRNALNPVLTNYNFKSEKGFKDETSQKEFEAETAKLKPQFEILLLNVIHGFWSPSGFVDAVVSNYFCCVPDNWTEDGKIKEEFAEKIFLKIFGQHWKTGSSNDPYRIVFAYSSLILDRRLAEEIDWSEMETDDRNRYQFYIASESGNIKAVYAKDFRK